jgi:hypothetical protein
MTYTRTIVGALSIMMASGLIADFDVVETGREVYVRVWSIDGRDPLHLQKHVAAILPPHIHERHVTVVIPSET